MSSQLQRCQACGRAAEQDEQFQFFRPTGPGKKGEEELMAAETLLCPVCAAERQQAGDFELAYRFCDQCAAPVEPNQAQLRSKTSTALGGAAPFHHTVRMVLCPRCAGRYDGTGRWLLVCLSIFVGGIVLLGVLGRFFR